MEVDLNRINPTSMPAYMHEGPGIGGNETAVQFLREITGVSLAPGHAILDVGFGKGGVLQDGVRAYCRLVAGVDAAQASIQHMDNWAAENHTLFSISDCGDAPSMELHHLDASHTPLPWMDDTFDIVICTETIEHFTNPYYMVSEVKRVLVPDGMFLIAFPRPEDNLGPGGGEHMHVYPGFLTKDSFELFMIQMYFRAKIRRVNGSTAWYAYRNYKGPGVVDTFHMVAGNYTLEQLYSCMGETAVEEARNAIVRIRNINQD